MFCNSYLIPSLVNANSIIFNLVANNLKGKKQLQVFFTIKKAIKVSANSNSYPFYWSKSFTPLIPIKASANSNSYPFYYSFAYQKLIIIITTNLDMHLVVLRNHVPLTLISFLLYFGGLLCEMVRCPIKWVQLTS